MWFDVCLGILFDKFRAAVRAGAANADDSLVGFNFGQDGDAYAVLPFFKWVVAGEQADADIGYFNIFPFNAIEGIIAFVIAVRGSKG